MRSTTVQIVALILLAFCAGLPAHAADRAAVSGTLTNGQGEAIAGAKVELSAGGGTAQHAVSDTQGRFVLQAMAPGTYALSVSAAHFQKLQKSVVVADGGSDLAIRLQPEVREMESPEWSQPGLALAAGADKSGEAE